MRYGSVCSGIESASVAWEPLGWEPAWFSEIEPFPSAVLAHHYPGVTNHGDFTTITSAAGGGIDLLVGGTPCQAFSVAGKRAGLDDPRGNLTMEYLRLAGRLQPRWIVWENVPGVLSIDGGRTFGAFLGTLGKLGYGFAYRVLDAQNFGVPQRRRRVFVVGYLGNWRPAAAVLFERESMLGYSAKGRKKEKGATRAIAVGPSGGEFTETSCTLDARCKDGAIRNQLGMLAMDQVAYGGNNTEGPISVATACNAKGGAGRMYFESETFIAFNLRGREGGAQVEVTDMASLRAASGGSSRSYVATSGVRRLTPTECERLQGFPDGYTQVPYRNKASADGPRYKAIGNSMAVTCMHWIGSRIAKVEKALLSKTQKDAA